MKGKEFVAMSAAIALGVVVGHIVASQVQKALNL